MRPTYFCTKCKSHHYFDSKIGLLHNKPAKLKLDTETLEKFNNGTLTRQEYDEAMKRWEEYDSKQRVQSDLKHIREWVITHPYGSYKFKGE